MCVCMRVVSCVQLFVTPWTVACQPPLSMEFSRQEYWSGLPLGFTPQHTLAFQRRTVWIRPSCTASVLPTRVEEPQAVTREAMVFPKHWPWEKPVLPSCSAQQWWGHHISELSYTMWLLFLASKLPGLIVRLLVPVRCLITFSKFPFLLKPARRWKCLLLSVSGQTDNTVVVFF